MPLGRSREPFTSPDWIFELKYDGFRALAEIEYGPYHNAHASERDSAAALRSECPKIIFRLPDRQLWRQPWRPLWQQAHWSCVLRSNL